MLGFIIKDIIDNKRKKKHKLFLLNKLKTVTDEALRKDIKTRLNMLDCLWYKDYILFYGKDK